METENGEKLFHGDRYKVALDWDDAFESMYWISKIPFLKFPQGWLVKPIPPFMGAIVRFLVTTEELGEHRVSVYLDGYSLIGSFGFEKNQPIPYWEVYGTDIYRCDINDTDQLMQNIQKAMDDIKQEITRPSEEKSSVPEDEL